jgi:tellurite methyltransferase
VKDQVNSDPILLARFLDPRPSLEAFKSPIIDAVNIPFEELDARSAELPSRRKPIQVVGPESLVAETVNFLRIRGREAMAVNDFSFGKNKSVGRLWQPHDWLESAVATRNEECGKEPGSACDLGCGGGRDSVYLAALGWRVVAVDNLPDAIDRARNLSRHYLNVERQGLIEWQVADATSLDFQPGRQFDLIACIFLFDRKMIQRAKTWLAPHGTLLMEAFTTIRQKKEGKPTSSDRVVKPGEMIDLLDDMEILGLDEGEHGHGHTARVMAQKHG